MISLLKLFPITTLYCICSILFTVHFQFYCILCTVSLHVFIKCFCIIFLPSFIFLINRVKFHFFFTSTTTIPCEEIFYWKFNLLHRIFSTTLFWFRVWTVMWMEIKILNQTFLSDVFFIKCNATTEKQDLWGICSTTEIAYMIFRDTEYKQPEVFWLGHS